MQRLNLATRPFYNERGVHLGLAILALLLLGATALNLLAYQRLSAREGELTGRTAVEETRAQALREQAAALRRSVRQEELTLVLGAAREANALIDQRTFSWTALFNHLEATLPDNVMLTVVRPRVEPEDVSLSLGVIGREVGDIDAFMTRLEDTGAFRDVLSRDERLLDDGTYEAMLQAIYVPTVEPAPDDATPGRAASAPAAPAAGRAGAPATPARAATARNPAGAPR